MTPDEAKEITRQIIEKIEHDHEMIMMNQTDFNYIFNTILATATKKRKKNETETLS